MSKKIYIKDLNSYLSKEIIADFLVTKKELRKGKNHYIRLNLADKTGNVTANVWNNAKSIAQKFEEGDIIRIKGYVITYKTQTQVTVKKIEQIPEEEYEIGDFIETTSKDINQLSDQLFEYIESIEDQHLKQLLLNIFEDKEFFTSFSESPAAKSWHHNYVGGLLEHTVAVTKICDFAAQNYKVDRDLLLTGALLHDIGKVLEYRTKPNIEFTAEGRLVGHIPLGDQIVNEKASQINNFSKDTLMKVRHLILAHHGEYEKASARLPQTIEAIVLHFADNLDAQTVGVQQLIDNRLQEDVDWTEYDRLNNRYYYIK